MILQNFAEILFIRVKYLRVLEELHLEVGFIHSHWPLIHSEYSSLAWHWDELRQGLPRDTGDGSVSGVTADMTPLALKKMLVKCQYFNLSFRSLLKVIMLF